MLKVQICRYCHKVLAIPATRKLRADFFCSIRCGMEDLMDNGVKPGHRIRVRRVRR